MTTPVHDRLDLRSLLVALMVAGCTNTELPAPALDAPVLPPTGTFVTVEKSLVELQAAMTDGQTSARALVDAYFARIAAYDRRGPSLRAMLTIDETRAREQADGLDDERSSGQVRGPLHGIPFVVKDSIDVAGLPTSGGALALEQSLPTADAFVVARLRAAGAIVLGKTNLDELQQGGYGRSTLGGQTLNPYDLSRIPGGSSAGTAVGVAANLAAFGLGADTASSLRVPAANNSLVTLRPSMGLISSTGSMPGTYTRDVLGPMTRSVADLAMVLDVITGADPADPVTARSIGKIPSGGYAGALSPGGLAGVRIGYFPFMQELVPLDDPADFEDRKQALAVAAEVLRDLVAQGAILVPLERPAPVIAALDELRTAVDGAGDGKCSQLWQAYLAGTSSTIRTLDQLITTGSATLYRDHPLAVRAISMIGLFTKRDAPRNAAQEAQFDTAQALFQARFADYLAGQGVEFLVLLPGSKMPSIAPSEPFGIDVPSIGVTGGDELGVYISSDGGVPQLQVPAGFTPDGVPMSMALLGAAFSEAALIRAGFAYEQATQHRRAPEVTP